MNILGLGGLLNDPAAVVLKDGSLAAAVEQKKVARRFTPAELPDEAIAEALRLAKLRSADIGVLAVARPFSERGDSRLHLRLRSVFPSSRIIVVEHHRAHAASAYYCSPFEKATVLTLDRAGDFRCGARWLGDGTHLSLDSETYFPDSLGDLYGRFTELIGFSARADEHKLQWLSTQGEPAHTELLAELLPRAGHGWPRPDRSFFDAERQGHGGFSSKFYQRLGLDEGAPVPPARRAALAASLQKAVENAVLELAGEGDSLCLAGGLFMNALLVSAIERSGRWKSVFVQPVAGNAGTSLGAALHAWHAIAGEKRRVPLTTLALGPSYTPEETKQVLENCKLSFRLLLTTGELIDRAVDLLAGNRIVAWMHGRMEFGPRALGRRSILASPLDPYSTENLNEFIKRREAFRKFAASVPEERAAEYFEPGDNAEFLATVGRVKPAHKETFAHALVGQDLIRVHTVRREENPLFHKLLLAWGQKTGLPVLYNTSFNLFGDPLVCTPRDAVRSFYSSGIDAMFAGHFLLEK